MVIPVVGSESYVNRNFFIEAIFPTDVITLPNFMAITSKTKRDLRRQVTQQFKQTERSMDVLPFAAKTIAQEDLWFSLEDNTVTVAIGPAGVGKTLVALWWGLQSIKQNKLQKVYYLRSDIGCAHQRGRGALPGTMQEKMAPLVGSVVGAGVVVIESTNAEGSVVAAGGIAEEGICAGGSVEVAGGVAGEGICAVGSV